MQLTILGGGGFRVPLVYGAVAAGVSESVDGAAGLIDHVVLYDVDPVRLAAIAAVIAGDQTADQARPRVTITTDLREAVLGADFVFCAVRVGGGRGRVVDERVALDLGLLGQETIGAGGLAYAMRTIPEMTAIAHVIAEHAPKAWVINFTNPAGIVTQAMARVLPGRVVGICDTPIGLVRRCARVLGRNESDLRYDYLGLNHLGWLRSLSSDGVDLLPRILADDELLDGIEEARLMGFDWVRAQRALPNEYLYYYWFHAAATASIAGAERTRGEFLVEQLREFYSPDAAANPPSSHAETAQQRWQRVLAEREATYMAEAREEDRRAEDVAGGGYQEVAWQLMTALATGLTTQGRTATMILDVPNDGLVPQLPSETVIEVACRVDADGIHPLPVAPPTLDQLGLMARLRAAEQFALEASLSGDRDLAWRAFAEHPLVNSPELGARLLDGYVAGHPELAAVFSHSSSSASEPEQRRRWNQIPSPNRSPLE